MWFYVVAFIAVLYMLFDVNYFIRIIFTIGLARYFQRKVKPFDETVIYGICTTNDVDIFIRHMNNARYVRELDFARFDFYDRSNLYNEVVKRKGNAMQGASNVRYRRTIPIFNVYKIVTKLIYWDDKAIYLEQKFITLSDGFVRAVALSKQNLVNVDVEDMIKKLCGQEFSKPKMPEELEKWLQSIEISSSKLRKSD
ncbi:protein THEM6 [Ischnura elegans]|uniref:protein THEM6 n=1 Tax=Ischnura elegans TaxID=197161 RepID=UPI001ED89099|nr:protein THEM6 [Ischnura elegans]